MGVLHSAESGWFLLGFHCGLMARRWKQNLPMMIAFKLLGALVILYLAHALSTGRVYAKRGVWGAFSKRDDEPVRYWATIVIYAVLAVGLLFYF